MYSYDRTATNSATPIFDRLAKEADSIRTALGSAAKRVDGLATKAEKAFKTPDNPEVFKLLTQALDVAYKVLDPLRPLNHRGDDEMRAIGDHQAAVFQQARNLYGAVRDLFKAYDAAMFALQEKDDAVAVKAIHNLVMALSFTKSILGQYEEVYGH